MAMEEPKGWGGLDFSHIEPRDDGGTARCTWSSGICKRNKTNALLPSAILV